MPAIAVVGSTSTGHEGFAPSVATEGAPLVRVGGRPVHCVGHAWQEHSCGGETHRGVLIFGAPHVFINGRPVGRVGDKLSCGDTVATGNPTVIVGNGGGVAYGLKVLKSAVSDPKDKLLLCLPEIAEAEASRAANPEDKQGWHYLQNMFYQWFTSPANSDAARCPNIFWIDWDWVMQFSRARLAYSWFTSTDFDKPENVYNPEAKRQLAAYLTLDGKFTNQEETFDYTALPPDQWGGRAFNFRQVKNGFNVDGLSAALRAFTFRALAKGTVTLKPDGTYLVNVTGVSVFVYDTFNFEGDEAYGIWDCASKKIYAKLSLFSQCKKL